MAEGEGKRERGGVGGRQIVLLYAYLAYYFLWPAVQSNNPTKLKSNTQIHTQHTQTHTHAHTHSALTLMRSQRACHDLHIELYEATLIAEASSCEREREKKGASAIKTRAPLPKAPSNRAENARVE